MRRAAEESQALQVKLAKSIAAAAELEQLVETRQQEMQESQRAMEAAYDSHKSSLGSKVDQAVKARERKEQTPEELTELEKKIQELIGGASGSTADDITEQLKQAAHKCYEALKLKCSAAAHASLRRGPNTATEDQDDDEDMWNEDDRHSAMDAKSFSKRPKEEKLAPALAAKSSEGRDDEPELKRSRDRSRSPLQTADKGQPGKGAGRGKDSKGDTEQSTSQG